MNFGALSRGFGTRCLRFKNGVATVPARLASGWLASLCREGVEPSGSLQRFQFVSSSSSGLGLAQGKFHRVPFSEMLCTIRPRSAFDWRTTQSYSSYCLRLPAGSARTANCWSENGTFSLYGQLSNKLSDLPLCATYSVLKLCTSRRERQFRNFRLRFWEFASRICCGCSGPNLAPSGVSLRRNDTSGVGGRPDSSPISGRRKQWRHRRVSLVSFSSFTAIFRAPPRMCPC
jgi:hypothetical protein